MKIHFTGTPAYVYICPVCKSRYIGGDGEKDQGATDWMSLHANWHQKHPNDTTPPISEINLNSLRIV